MVVTVTSGTFAFAIAITVVSSDSQAIGNRTWILFRIIDSVVEVMEPLCNNYICIAYSYA